MRNILFMAVFSLGLCSFTAEKISAWDFPLTLYPIAIKFDHGGANDAINIRKNYLTDITAPEYVASPAKNEKFAYVKGAAPTVKVKFYASPSDSTTSLTIDAFERYCQKCHEKVRE